MSVPVMNFKRSERGAALLTVAAVAILIGVLMTMGVGIFHREQPEDLRFETLARQDFLMDQIASYVHRNRDLPCPAAPNETPGDTDFGTERAVCNTAATAVGIVPYRALNLDEEMARDAWGRFFTYAISPVFANPDPANDNGIFYRCRSERWINDEVPGTRNENPQKARFCCPAPVLAALDLSITDGNGNAQQPAPGFAGRSAAGGHYGNMDTEEAALIPGVTATAFAVVLVSHGSNGAGAFAGDGTNGKFPDPASATELENSNDDNVFVDRAMVLEDGANYFDDIIMWRTQTALYSELNNASCFRPWR